MWEWHEGMHWGFSFGGVFMILFWATIIGVSVWAIKRLTERGNTHANTTTIATKPMDIAKERYAKGEITKEEFEQLKKDLSKEY
ncbi:MAG: SHOCT domain-containing protein [Dehalococcoidales bacterium]